MKEAIILRSWDTDTVYRIKIDGIIYEAVEDKPETGGCEECCFKCGDDNCTRVPGYCAACLRTDGQNVHWVKLENQE